jgi:hypothetical protein
VDWAVEQQPSFVLTSQSFILRIVHRGSVRDYCASAVAAGSVPADIHPASERRAKGTEAIHLHLCQAVEDTYL